MQTKGKEIRYKYLLDFHNHNIESNADAEKITKASNIKSFKRKIKESLFLLSKIKFRQKYEKILEKIVLNM